MNVTRLEVLERLKNQNNGVIPPEKLVHEAVAVDHPFHNDFTWDDDAAAHRWRIHQARNILRVYVTMIGSGEDAKSSRVFVSLSTDRNNGGGYRAMVDVLNDDAMYATLLSDAKDDMVRFRQK